MRLNELPIGYEWIDQVAAEPNTVLAWDNTQQRKVWLTTVPLATSLQEAVSRVQHHANNTDQFEVVAGQEVSWLVRPVPDDGETIRVEIEVENEADMLHEYPEEWVTGRRPRTERRPTSTPNKRRLAWVAANALAFSVAFGYDPEWSHTLTRSSYFLLGGGLYALSFGTAQWAVLKDRLRQPGKWFVVAALGQALSWFLLYFWAMPFLTVFGVMGLTAFLHLKFSPEVIKNPARWMVGYPLAWTMAYFFLWTFVGGMSYTVGAIPGIMIAMMTMFVLRFQTKEEAAAQ